MNMKGILLLFLSGALSCVASIWLKIAAQKEILSLENPGALRKYAFAIAAYGLGFAAYAIALKSIRLNIAYPLMVGFATLFVYIWTALVGHESLSLHGIAGAVFVVTGIFLMSNK
ncbi:MAG: ligand-binding protein SH3 [Candidatus Accumulibacter sp.]|jgi:multidrug transporter EmrE-like cation transporter|nr:ligand-binding protein SH3 [Accumulibacter sp.]